MIAQSIERRISITVPHPVKTPIPNGPMQSRIAIIKGSTKGSIPNGAGPIVEWGFLFFSPVQRIL